MGLQKMFQRNGDNVAVEVEPYEKICREMNDTGKLLALYTRDGHFLVDQFGKYKDIDKIDPEEAFYLAMNLNFVYSFSNSVKLGIYNQSGTELMSPELASFKLVYHMDEDSVIHTGGVGDVPKVNLKDYEHGILLIRLKNPREWQVPAAGMVRVNLQVSLIFNQRELENFLLKVPI